MKVQMGVDGSSQGLSGARLVATLPLSASDEVIVASVIDRPFLIGAWGYVPSPANERPRGAHACSVSMNPMTSPLVTIV